MYIETILAQKRIAANVAHRVRTDTNVTYIINRVYDELILLISTLIRDLLLDGERRPRKKQITTVNKYSLITEPAHPP